MATFTITLPNTNVDTLAGKAGGDTYNINGGTLVIDQDTRFGENASATGTPGTIAVSPTYGGIVDVDARAVRWIPYNTGSGNVPAGGTVITQGGASGKLICVASAINVAPTAPAAAMPASGWIKVKQVSGAFAAGALTGIGASATGADVVAPISLVGDEAGTFSVPRLGSAQFRGAWYEVGTTSGVNTTDYQLPTQGEAFYLAGVQVETAAGSGVYAWWACTGSMAAAAGNVGAEELRGSVCWISTAGVLRLGRDLSGNTTGYTPGAGRKIRIPNILTANCTTAARGVNAPPNASFVTRFEFATIASGSLSFDICSINWYPNVNQGYALTMTDTVIGDQLLIQEVATEVIGTRVCIGPTAALAQPALSALLCPSGVTFTDSVFTRGPAATSGSLTISSTDCPNMTFLRCKAQNLNARGATNILVAQASRCANFQWLDSTSINGTLRITTCAGWTVRNLVYADVTTETTGTTNALQAVYAEGASSNGLFDGVSFGGLTNVHPYTALLNVSTVNGVKFRNVGTLVSPLSLGSANACGTALTYTGTADNRKVKAQRVYVSNTRTALFSQANESYDTVIENCAGDYADAPAILANRATVRGTACTLSVAGQNAVYGSIWNDCFTSTTAGRLIILMNEPTASEAAQVTLENGAAYTGTGRLYMPTIGMAVTFEQPYFMLGHTGFQNAVAVMGGGTIGDYSLEFQANTGSGFGAWAALTGANLAAVGAFPSTGVKLKVRITTTTTNSTAITSLYLLTTSTTTAQETQLYPLDTFPVSVNGLIADSQVKVTRTDNDAVLFNGNSGAGSTVSFETDYAGEVAIEARKASAAPYYRPWRTVATVGAGLTATALQELD